MNRCRFLMVVGFMSLVTAASDASSNETESSTLASRPAASIKHSPKLVPSHKKSTQKRRHSPRPAGPAYVRRPDAMKVANDIARRLQINPVWTRHQVGKARFQSQVVKLIAPAAAGTAKNWQLYRTRFVTPERIEAGIRFWHDHRVWLELAEKQTGVPPAIVVGVLGVETRYGQQMGSFRVLDALATLAFDFPPQHPRASERSAFFRAELEHYLKLTHDAGIDPLSLRGSYAGAMGMPQFMPTSWLQYAVDFDGDGRIDLFGSSADAIGSVAHYFQAFHWQAGMPSYFAVSFDGEKLDLEALLAPDIRPTFSVASLNAKGVRLDPVAQQYRGHLALIELQNGAAAPSYVAGTDNFYTITRYNWSSYYAMAVLELGREIETALGSAK